MKILLYTFCYILYPFSFLFVRNKRKYAFGSFAGRFNDNAKYFFIYTCQHCSDINAAWISSSMATVRLVRSLGFKAYHLASPQGVWHSLTSKYWFFNSYTSDIFYSFSGGAVCVNLWHGVGLKRIEYNILSGLLPPPVVQGTRLFGYFYPLSDASVLFLISNSSGPLPGVRVSSQRDFDWRGRIAHRFYHNIRTPWSPPDDRKDGSLQ